MTDTIEIRVPDIGDFDEVDIIEVLVSPGDNVGADDGLITLETDKASMDVPADQAGEIVELKVGVGDKVSEGSVIALMRPADASDEPAAQAESEPESEPEPRSEPEPEPEAVAEPAAAPASVTVTVPDIGDFDDVDIIEVEVKVGDEIDVDDPLITLETDKASMDVPSTHAGTVEEVLVSVGDRVSEGSAIVRLASAGAPAAAAAPASRESKSEPEPAAKRSLEPRHEQAPKPEPEPGPESRSGPGGVIDEAGFSRAHASPAVRKLARELGVDLARVKGSGRKGRILASDLKAWVKKTLEGGGAAAAGGTALPQVPKVDFAKFGDVSEVPLTRIQKISGPRLQASWINLPHVTQHDQADITDMEARRKALKDKAAERGIKLTPLAFVVRAVVQALAEHPKLNASLNAAGDGLVMKRYCHIGFAADTDDGLVVPVIHDADKKDIYELAQALAELSSRARDGKLSAKEMQGATFTISSLGGIGGTAFTPIVNAPEVAILGVSRHAMQPVWDGEQFVPRLMLPLSLSYDHRVIDGALAVRFTTYLGQCLSNVDGLLQAIP